MAGKGLLVPTIDIGPFLQDEASAEAGRVVDAVRDACQNTGFFQMTGHGLARELQLELQRAAQRFFALPAQSKLAMDARATVGRRGYDVLAAQSYTSDVLPDLKEGFYVGPDVPLDHPDVVARRFFMGPNVWPEPDALPERDFRRPVEAYFDAIHALALKLLALVARTLPHGPGIFDAFTRGHTVAVLRMLHYPPVPADEGAATGGKTQFGAGAHTDFGAITLLMQDENRGLEVLDPETGEYVPVDPNPEALVVNVGDMLSMWTGGAYKSSWHRVINKAPVDRYSAAFFYDGALDCPLLPLDGSGVAGEGTLTVEKHMIKRITESYGGGKPVTA